MAIGNGVRAAVGGVAADRAVRASVTVYFFMCGAAAANWFARIPDVKQRLGLDDGELGLALLGSPVGSLIAIPTAGWFISRSGSRWLTPATALVFCVALPLLALAPNLIALAGGLALFGAAFGAIDVAMNSQAVAVERRYGRPIMVTFHAFFSVGGLVGAVTAGVVAERGIAPAPHLLGVAVVLAVAGVLAGRRLLPASVDAVPSGPAFARPSRALAGLGAVIFCVALGEGAVADWGAVYLREDLLTGPGLAAAGYGAFALAMAAGRFGGDALTARFGAATVVRAGGALAAVGLGLALLVEQPLVTLIGFGAVGAGLASGFPLVIAAAGRTPNVAPGPALAAVTTIGYTGFLVGPPLIGLVADGIGLRGGLVIVVLLAVASALLAGAVGRADAPILEADALAGATVKRYEAVGT